MERLKVFDTTLRDGEQSPGCTLNFEEKVEIAHALERLGVDIIEAGFPATSAGDFDAVRTIAQQCRNCSVTGLTHGNRAAIDRLWEAVKVGVQPRIHIVVSTSDIHLTHQLNKNREEAQALSRDSVKYASQYTSDIEFSPMDATRSDPQYLFDVLTAVIDAGATTVNIADTVGYSQPEEFYALIRGVFENVPNIHKATVSCHCHNDLGMATANSLAGIKAGVRQVECTINGLGERAGNASLEEIVMALKTRQDFYNLETRIDTTQIYRTSRLVSELTGMPVQPNKAVVGGNAFRHESGLHQDGIIKKPITYEIMRPEDIGLGSRELVLGKHSGRHGFRQRLKELGMELSDDEMQAAFERFKKLTDQKKVVTDSDLEAIIADELRTASEMYKLESIQVSCGEPSIPTASVRIVDPDGRVLSDAALGDGPVDAVYKAINRLIQVPNELIEFSVQSVTEGIDAVGEVTIRIKSDGHVFTGRGASTDIIVASAKAYMSALNKLLERGVEAGTPLEREASPV